MGKIGIGEYEIQINGESKPSTIDARNIFLKCIEDNVPMVLKELSENPYKLYLKTNLYYGSDKEHSKNPSKAKRFNWKKNKRPSWWALEVGNPFIPKENLHINKDENVKKFVESIFDWSKKHNLNHFWCREIAYETLDFWFKSPSGLKEVNWKFEIPLAQSVERGGKFIYEIYLDYPLYGFRKEVREENISLFKKWLDNVLDECESNPKQDGLIKTIKYHDDFDHFKWLAMYQCMPLSCMKISEIVNKDRKTVEDGLKKAAKVCELKLRSSLTPGRKRKGRYYGLKLFSHTHPRLDRCLPMSTKSLKPILSVCRY